MYIPDTRGLEEKHTHIIAQTDTITCMTFIHHIGNSTTVNTVVEGTRQYLAVVQLCGLGVLAFWHPIIHNKLLVMC